MVGVVLRSTLRTDFFIRLGIETRADVPSKPAGQGVQWSPPSTTRVSNRAIEARCETKGMDVVSGSTLSKCGYPPTGLCVWSPRRAQARKTVLGPRGTSQCRPVSVGNRSRRRSRDHHAAGLYEHSPSSRPLPHARVDGRPSLDRGMRTTCGHLHARDHHG
jgi:hypothetical protein